MGINIGNTLVIGLFFAMVSSQYAKKPWPTYSLQNMPRTDFSCHDKILGGYYADAETQCQMFHVCVKVAGVGVQDFRFLCPNGTAFDQEAQICADWGDVDCEQATLYYSSDNFDLYRIGSGFETKRAPTADEEEATFHLQRAETSDIRHSKQTVIDQKYHPEKASQYRENNYPPQNAVKSPVVVNRGNFNNEQKQTNVKKPVFKSTSPSYSNSPSTTKSYEPSYDSNDEIFKGSHSSNFYNNRFNGKEDDLVDFNKPSSSPTKAQVTRTRQRGRGQVVHRNYQANSNVLSHPTKPYTSTTTTTQEPEIITDIPRAVIPFNRDNPKSQTFTLQSSFRPSEKQDNLSGVDRVTPVGVTSTTSATTLSSPSPFQPNYSPTKPQTQLKIQPTTYNPSNNGFKFKVTTSKYEEYDIPVKNSPLTNQQQHQPQSRLQVSQNQNPFYNTQYENKATEYNYENYDKQINSKKIKGQKTVSTVYNEQTNSSFSNKYNGDSVSKNKQQGVPQGVNTSRRGEQYQPPSQQQQQQQHQQQQQRQQQQQQRQQPQQQKQQYQEQFLRQSQQQIQGQKQQQQQQHQQQQQQNQQQQQQKQRNQQTQARQFNPTNSDQNQRTGAQPSQKLSVRPLPNEKVAQPLANNQTNPENDYRQRNSNNRVFLGNFNINTQANQPSSKNDFVQQQQQTQQSSSKPPPPYPPFNEYRSTSTSLPPYQHSPVSFDYTPRGFSKNTPPTSNAQSNGRTPAPSSSPSGTPSYHNSNNFYDNYQTLNRSHESQTPSTSTKRFSTLVPKDQYYPTTFKPTTYKKQVDVYTTKYDKTTSVAPSKYSSVSSSHGYLPTTTQIPIQRASTIPDEHDGQYHPELYEKDFPRNQFKLKHKQQQQKQFETNDEDEFLKTAHSLNIAAGANQLRTEKAKQSSLTSTKNYKSQTSNINSSSSSLSPPKQHTSTTKPKIPRNNEDASYDYAYYDSDKVGSRDYTDYDVVSEFGKTKKQ